MARRWRFPTLLGHQHSVLPPTSLPTVIYSLLCKRTLLYLQEIYVSILTNPCNNLEKSMYNKSKNQHYWANSTQYYHPLPHCYIFPFVQKEHFRIFKRLTSKIVRVNGSKILGTRNIRRREKCKSSGGVSLLFKIDIIDKKYFEHRT